MRLEIEAAEKLNKPVMYILQELVDENLAIRQVHEPLGIIDCIPDSNTQNYKNQILVLDPEILHRNCRNAQNSLWLAYNGFGCRYGARGRAVFAENLFDGEQSSWDRSDFLGIVKTESLKKWLNDMPDQKQRTHSIIKEFENTEDLEH